MRASGLSAQPNGPNDDSADMWASRLHQNQIGGRLNPVNAAAGLKRPKCLQNRRSNWRSNMMGRDDHQNIGVVPVDNHLEGRTPNDRSMTLQLRALVLGYGTAALAGFGLAGAVVDPWIAFVIAWLGGAVLSLAFIGIEVRLEPDRHPEKPLALCGLT